MAEHSCHPFDAPHPKPAGPRALKSAVVSSGYERVALDFRAKTREPKSQKREETTTLMWLATKTGNTKQEGGRVIVWVGP